MAGKIHYLLRKGPPLVRILSQINPVLARQSYAFEICFNFMVSSTNVSSKWISSSRFNHHNSLSPPPPQPTFHSPRRTYALHLLTLLIFREK